MRGGKGIPRQQLGSRHRTGGKSARRIVPPTARSIRRLAITTLTLTLSFAARGATIYVDVTKPCPGAGTQASPYCTIQGAICHSVAGDLVSVAPGTYAESLRMRPGVSVVSTGGAAVTTINGTGKPCIKGAGTPPDPVNDYCAVLSGSTQ